MDEFGAYVLISTEHVDIIDVGRSLRSGCCQSCSSVGSSSVIYGTAIGSVSSRSCLEQRPRPLALFDCQIRKACVDVVRKNALAFEFAKDSLSELFGRQRHYFFGLSSVVIDRDLEQDLVPIVIL